MMTMCATSRLLGFLCLLFCCSRSIWITEAVPNGRLFCRVRVAPYSVSTAPSKHQPDVSSLSRGGGGAKEDDEADIIKSDAIASMKSCYRSAFFAFFADAFDALYNNDKPLDIHNLSWADALEFAESLNKLTFGIGLFRVTQLYAKDLDDVTSNDILQSTKIMAAPWWNTAVVLVLGSMAAESSGESVKSRVLKPLSILAGALVGGLATVDTSEPPPVAKDPVLQEARKTGFLASRNMALCMGAFVVEGVERGVDLFVRGRPANPIARILKVNGVVQPFIIAGLLRNLYQSYREAVIKATDRKKHTKESYNELYVAQKGFYTKIQGPLLVPSLIKFGTPIIMYLLEKWAFSED